VLAVTALAHLTGEHALTFIDQCSQSRVADLGTNSVLGALRWFTTTLAIESAANLTCTG
jgi:hypothetical protein